MKHSLDEEVFDLTEWKFSLFSQLPRQSATLTSLCMLYSSVEDRHLELHGFKLGHAWMSLISSHESNHADLK